MTQEERQAARERDYEKIRQRYTTQADLQIIRACWEGLFTDLAIEAQDQKTFTIEEIDEILHPAYSRTIAALGRLQESVGVKVSS
jgi:hypothetical protein